MEPEFWRERWANGQIGFHEGKPNTHLERHFERLALGPDAHVFVPLCGKTRDIAWLLGQGVRVTGAELSAIAVTQLFEELGVAPTVCEAGAMTRYSAPNIDIFQGDIFDLTREMLGPVAAVYDRAALVALPGPLRARYAAHLTHISAAVPQLVISIDYDQSLASGPPFAVGAADTQALYGQSHRVTLLDSIELDEGLKGKYPAREHVWLFGRL